MTTSTFQEYDELVRLGFTEDHARHLSDRHLTAKGTESEFAHAIERMNSRLDSIDARLDRIEKRLDSLETRVTSIEGEVSQLRAEMHVLDERMRSESRMQRFVNTTLIAIGALLGSLLAVFAR